MQFWILNSGRVFLPIAKDRYPNNNAKGLPFKILLRPCWICFDCTSYTLKSVMPKSDNVGYFFVAFILFILVQRLSVSTNLKADEICMGKSQMVYQSVILKCFLISYRSLTKWLPTRNLSARTYFSVSLLSVVFAKQVWFEIRWQLLVKNLVI